MFWRVLESMNWKRGKLGFQIVDLSFCFISYLEKSDVPAKSQQQKTQSAAPSFSSSGNHIIIEKGTAAEPQ